MEYFGSARLPRRRYSRAAFAPLRIPPVMWQQTLRHIAARMGLFTVAGRQVRLMSLPW